MARRNADSDHWPIPVSASGVIFEEKMVPNGVGTGRPPAKDLPPRTVWQSLQLPIAASSRPRLTRTVSNDCGAGGSIAAIAGRHAIAHAANAPPINSAATTLAIIRDFFIRPEVIRPDSFWSVPSTNPWSVPPDRRLDIPVCLRGQAIRAVRQAAKFNF